MIKCEDGHVEMGGSGSDLIIDLAIIIRTFRDAFEEHADKAYEAALAMSKEDTMKMFEEGMADA